MASHSFRFGTALCATMLVAASAFGAASVKPLPVVDTTTAAGRVIDQSDTYNSSATYKAEKAFDRGFTDMNSCWISKLDANNPNAFFVYEFNTPTVVDGIRLQNSEKWSETSRAPKNWTFEGSNDTNGIWTVLDAQTGHTGWTSNEFRTCFFENKSAYKYYKYNCTVNNGAAYVALCEVEFLQGGVRDLTTSGSGSVIDSSPATVSSGVTYGADRAFDGVKHNANGRWLTPKSSDMYLVYKFNQPTFVNAISLFLPGNTLGWNSATRAPKDWTFSGSDDGTSWTTLDTQTGEDDWSIFPEERYYEFLNSHAYQYYKFNCTALNGATDSLQLMEIEFYYHNEGAPGLGECAVEKSSASATAFDISAKLLVNGADTVSYIVSDGVEATTNAFANSVAEGATVTGTISGLLANKTYEISLLAENGKGVDLFKAGTFYTGTLALGDATNANEGTGAAGTVAVSRADEDPLPLTVYYTIAGSGGAEGTTWAAPVPVTIPAGAKTGYLLVAPLADLSVGEDVTVTVTLAEGNYGIPASPDDSAALKIVNDDDAFTITIVNGFEGPAGVDWGANYTLALTNDEDRVIRFTKPENAPSGLREFAHKAGDNINDAFTTNCWDWMLYPSINEASAATTVTSVRYASEDCTGLTAYQGVRTYAGSWYIPADGTYSFRMHMKRRGFFSLDGKLVLRQATSSAATVNDVELTAGWHTLYAAFAADGNGVIGPQVAGACGLTFSASNADLCESPGTPFDAAYCQFSTAFSAILVPSMWAKGGDVTIDCSNVLGDLRVSGQLACPPGSGHKFKFVNLPAGRTLEFGRPLKFAHPIYSWQNIRQFACVADWSSVEIPAEVNIRFEGGFIVTESWTAAGHGVWSDGDHSAYSLGKCVLLATEVANFFGTAGKEEFTFPDGMIYLAATKPTVLGDGVKVVQSGLVGIGIGGAPFRLTGSGSAATLPVTHFYAAGTYNNSFELGPDVTINPTLPWDGGDKIMGDIDGGNIRMTGYARKITCCGSVNVGTVRCEQMACRMLLYPKAGSAPSSFKNLELGAGMPAVNADPQYTGSMCYYLPAEEDAPPLSIGTVTVYATDAKSGMDQKAVDFYGSRTFGRRPGPTLTTCSNNTISVSKLTGAGIHLRTVAGTPSQWTAANDVEPDRGFANFVFDRIDGTYSHTVNDETVKDPMTIYVSSNVNIIATNIVRSAAFHYEVMSGGANPAVIEAVTNCAEGTTITATDVAMLPARVKGFTGRDITLTDETEGRTYPVVFDFDRQVPVGGCDGSGNLVAAPETGHIVLSFSGEPVRGKWGILRFDNANGKLDDWTIEAPTTYKAGRGKPLYLITVMKDANGFVMKASRSGVEVRLR